MPNSQNAIMTFKVILFFIITANGLFAQDSIDKEILINQILNDSTYGNGELRIIIELEKNPIEDALKKIDFAAEFANPESGSKIIVSREEKEQIKRGIQSQYGKTIDKKFFNAHKWISYKYIKPYLEQNISPVNSNRVMMITEPVFIRDGEICVIYTLHLCCGFGGQASLWFYKKDKSDWHKWIPISQGLF